MSNPQEFVFEKNGVKQTVPACTININAGEVSYRGEQLVLDGADIKETKVYDGTPDLYVTSGIINCHMHWMMNGDPTFFDVMLDEIVRDPGKKTEVAIQHARDTLRLGVTFGWDKGPPGVNCLPIYKGMLDAIAKGVPMTRFIYAPWAVMFAGGFGFPFGRALGKDSEMSVFLLELEACGADSLKFIPETSLKSADNSYEFLMSPELFMDTRKKLAEKGKLMCVHAKGVDSLDQCIAARVDCVEHGNQATNEQLKAMQENNIFLGPTFYGLECRLNLVKERKLNPAVAQYEWDSICEMAGRAAVLNDGKPFTHMVLSSDAGSYTTPHASIREFYLMRKYGWQPADIFEAATVNGAKCTRQEKMGSVQVGKQADLIYWKKNPLELSLEEWEHLEDHIAAVVLEGNTVTQN